MSDDRVADIPFQLFQRLAASNPTFKPSEYMKSYSRLTTNLQRVNFVFNDMKKYNVFPDIERDTKNDVIAAQFREKGNKHFRLGEDKQALEEYTRSVAAAKSEDVLALAYGNRSACSYRLKLYSNCITDIERAFSHNYPKELEEKLLKRREQAQKLLEPVERYYEEVPVIPNSEKNHQIQSARDSVRIEENQVFGRHVVAVKDISIGETVLVEEPFACVVTADSWIHCHECLELCYNAIPCNNCTQAVFCGETCKSKAQISFHQYACPLLLSIVEFGMVNSILIALKTAISAKHDYANVKKFDFKNGEYYRSDRYKEVHNLYTPKRKLSEHDSYYRAVMVSVLFHFLQTTSSFFENEAIEDGFKEVMLHQVQIALSNGVNIYEYAKENSHFDRRHFGGGVYSFFSLFNHSCIPNVEGSFYGSTIVLRTLNTIKKGQQCFLNYDTHYGTTPKAARQEILSKNFFFNCKCQACEEDWEAVLVDFHMNQIWVPDVQAKLSVADVNFAKYILPYLIEEFKKCERSEPWGKALTFKKLICCCYITLGNKRRV